MSLEDHILNDVVPEESITGRVLRVVEFQEMSDCHAGSI